MRLKLFLFFNAHEPPSSFVPAKKFNETSLLSRFLRIPSFFFFFRFRSTRKKLIMIFTLKTTRNKSTCRIDNLNNNCISYLMSSLIQFSRYTNNISYLSTHRPSSFLKILIFQIKLTLPKKIDQKSKEPWHTFVSNRSKYLTIASNRHGTRNLISLVTIKKEKKKKKYHGKFRANLQRSGRIIVHAE